MTVERAFVLRLFSLDLGSWHGLAVKLSTSRRQEWSIARQTAVVRFSLEIRCVEPFELTDRETGDTLRLRGRDCGCGGWGGVSEIRGGPAVYWTHELDEPPVE